MESLKTKTIGFKGTDYLGIATNKEFREYLFEGFLKYGSNFGGSRLSGTYAELFEEAENRLAQIAGMQASLSFSSGTLAGLALINSLDKNTELIYAPGTHPALAPRNNNQVKNFKQWMNQILQTFSEKGNEIILLSNSLSPLDVEKYDFSPLTSIADKRKITLIIDDSHGFGVIGKNGCGIAGELPEHPNIEKIIISSLGKAWALPGGVVLASKNRINQLKKSGLFGGASPINPAYLHAFLKAGKIYTHSRKHLINNINLFKKNIPEKCNFKYFDDFPVFYTKKHELFEILQKDNIEISSFNYPTPDDDKYTRIVITASHSQNDIIRCTRILKQIT